MFKKISLTVVIFLVFFLALEFVCRVLESRLTAPAVNEPKSRGWQAEFFSSMFDWHEPDPELLWRFKANLNNPLIKTNSAHFIGGEISKGKGSNTFRVMLLGDSSPVGLGLSSYQQSFGELLRERLSRQYPDKTIELVNAAVSGYTSEQILCFMESEGWSYRPDLVLVYCGNNDASVSGDRADRELIQKQQMVSVRRTLNRLTLYRVLRNVIVGAVKNDDGKHGALKVRVGPERYKENMTRLARQCRDKNCPLMVLKPPVPYLWPAGLQFKIFTHVTGEEGRLILPKKIIDVLGRKVKYCLDKRRFSSIYDEWDEFTRAVYASAFNDEMVPSRAVAFYEQQLARDSGNAVIRNNLGVSLWAEGNYNRADSVLRKARNLYCQNYTSGSDPVAEAAAGSPFLYNIGINLLTRMSTETDLTSYGDDTAFVYLDSALQADFFSLRVKKEYWRVIDNMNQFENVEVIDLPELFRDNGSERLFIDHCHPTVEGHRLIAGALFDRIVERGLIRP